MLNGRRPSLAPPSGAEQAYLRGEWTSSPLHFNVFNLYGAFMSTITVIEPFARLKATPRVRGLFMSSPGERRRWVKRCAEFKAKKIPGS